MFSSILLLLSLVLNPHIINHVQGWFLSEKLIDDPKFSCYILQNSSWMCIEDVQLKNYDPDDSY